MKDITVLQFDDNGSVWVWTSANSAHQMYKIERELCRHVNTTSFSRQMDNINMIKNEPCIVQHTTDRWVRAEIVDVRTAVTGQQEIEVSLWDLGGTDIVPEYKCCPMPDTLRDIPQLADQLFLDNVIPNTYHFPGASWSECVLNEMYKLTGLPSESGPVPVKADLLLNSKAVLYVVSEETNQLVNFNQHLIEQGLGSDKGDDRVELVKDISNEVYMEIPMREMIPVVRSLMFSKFPNSICKKLTELGFHSPTVIQQYGWPYLMAGYSCLLVSPSRTGKTLTYLLPLLSHVLTLNTVKKSHWPPAVIVMSSTQEAIRLNAIAQRILSWLTAHYRCCCYYHGNEADVIVQLLNGCMLLVTTLPLLIQLLKANHFKLTELQILVVDECDKVLSDGHEMEELMSYWTRHRDNISGHEKQLIMACSKVTQNLHKFVTNYMKGSVKLIACSIEAVVWNEVPMVVRCCDDNLDGTLLEQLNGFSECGNIMVTTNSTLKSQHVTKLLQQNSWSVINLDSPTTSSQASLFVITAEKLLSLTAVHLPIVNHLILYMLAKTKNEFKRSLATLYPAIKAKLKCTVTLLLAGDYTTQVVTIATMLNSMQVPLPPGLDDTLKKELESREQSASELCCDIKAWGSCKKLGCSYVHNVSHITNTHMIPPHIKLPTTGTVKFQVDHVSSAGQYWARLKEHIPIKFGDKPDTFQPSAQLIQLYTDLAQYHGDGKLSTLKNVTIGHCYGHCDAEKVCHRVQVLQLSEPLDGTMYFHKEKARVQLIDIGLIKIVDINQLWQLPEHLKIIPRQVIEIFMYGVMPAAGNGSWSGEANKLAHNYFYGKTLHGNIVFSHGNTLWLDTIEERVELKAVDVVTPLSSLRGQLLHLGLAEVNSGHLAQLKQATSDVSSNTSVIKQSYSELPLDEEYVDVYLSAVITPHMFYVQRADELDSIDSLVDQLNDKRFPHSVHYSALQLDNGAFCLALFPSDHKWYRGTVRSYNNSDKTYNIFFVDFGDSADVHRGNVQPIADRLINDYKFYAIQCSLANIKPFGMTWSSVAADELFEQCQDKQLVAKVIRTSISTDQWLGTHYVISLFDTTGPLDVSMVTMLVEENLARHCDPDVFVFTTALEGKKPVEQITLLRELQAKMVRHSRTMTLDKEDLTWVLQHLSDFTASVKQEVMSLLAHLTVSQPWLKLWLSEPNQLHPLEVQIQQFCESKLPESRLWNNFLKMLTTCAAKRKETLAQVKDDRIDKEEEKTVVTEVEEINHTGYERVYLPETDTSEDDDSNGDSDSSDDF